MGFKEYWEEKIHNFSLWDFSIFKIALVIFGMILGAYFAGFVLTYMTYFIIVFAVLYIYLIFKIFKK